MFGSKSCHIRVAIDTAAEITLFRSTFSSARADTTFDEWSNGHMHVFSFTFTFRAFSNPCVSVNTLSRSRVDTAISRSGSPHDASHLPSTREMRSISLVLGASPSPWASSSLVLGASPSPWASPSPS